MKPKWTLKRQIQSNGFTGLVYEDRSLAANFELWTEDISDKEKAHRKPIEDRFYYRWDWKPSLAYKTEAGFLRKLAKLSVQKYVSRKKVA